jgi:ribosomal protein S12 methylthiotransferase accessory factor
VRAPRRRPGALGVGAGTAPTIAKAWWKALSEAFAARAAGAKLSLLDRRELGPEGQGVVSFEDHIRYYADESNSAAAAFLDASEERVPVASVPPLERDDPAELVAGLCTRIEAAGSSAYAIDVTSPDVADLGLTVAKVIAPELCMLDAVHGARFLGGARLYEAAAELGLRPEPLADGDLNPHPHPFP